MSLSHNINDPSQYSYPISREPDLNYQLLVGSVVGHYYGAYLQRLERAGYSIPVNDYYHTYFGEFTPASIVTDSRGYPVLHPGYNKRWLVFHFSSGAVVRMYVARYLVQGKEGLRMYGDAVFGTPLPVGESGSAVAVLLDEAKVGVLRQDGARIL
jgi:hypothetical protein